MVRTESDGLLDMAEEALATCRAHVSMHHALMTKPEETPVWRRDGLSYVGLIPADKTASVLHATDDGVATRTERGDDHLHSHLASQSRAKALKQQHATISLLPITPVHEPASGTLDVGLVPTRVVYLAPLTTTAAEKFYARTRCRDPQDCNDSLPETNSTDKETIVVTSDAGGSPKRRAWVPSPVVGQGANIPTLRKLLAKIEMKERRKAPQAVEERISAFAHGHSMAFDNNNRSQPAGSVSKPTPGRQAGEQMERLKLQVRLMPRTEDDHVEFWQTMKNYQRMQLAFRATLVGVNASPMGFNMEAAWNRELLEKRHQLWVKAHGERIEASRTRKLIEDDKFEQHLLESTTEHRAQLRILREVRERLMLDTQTVLPTILLCAATQLMLDSLLKHWKQRQLQIRIRGIIKFWSHERSTRNTNVHAARVLINWLQKSVAVKSVAFRVFRGIRTYVRRVKRLQRLWRIKQAKRRCNFLLLQKLWTEVETQLVDQANEDAEKRRAKKDQNGARKKKRPAAKATPTLESPDAWLTFVAVDVRSDVIKDFIREKEVEYKSNFRRVEVLDFIIFRGISCVGRHLKLRLHTLRLQEELFPHLVQTLRCENPSRARCYIKAMASGYALLGLVVAKLREYPGAADDVPAIVPFDMHEAPIRELIRRAKARGPLKLTAV